jgi:Tol biopolymer transport system component
MATGARPFNGNTTAAMFDAILHKAPVSPLRLNPELPQELERIINKALEKDGDIRYQHASDLRADLKRLKRDMDSGRAAAAPYEPQPPTAAADRRFRWRWVIALAATAVVAMGFGVASLYWFGRSRSAAPEPTLMAVPLTTYLGRQMAPSFSPDGTQVAFSWNGENEGNSNIYVKLIGSEPPLRLTNNPAGDYSPAWSPDGRWIAFCRNLPGGKFAVVMTSPIPGPERILTNFYGDRNLSGPFLAWSPDSHWLTIAGSERPKEPPSLFLFSLETGEKRRITSPPAGNWEGDNCPAFSPDSRKLAFSRWAVWASSNLYLLDLSPDLKPVAEPKQITVGNWEAAGPAWTTDGKSLIFSTYSGAETSLWRVDVSGSSKPQRLTTLGDNTIQPAISRRGNRLAYAQNTGRHSIWRLEISTPGGKTKPPEKFIFSTRSDCCSEISPDGTKVVFWSNRSGSGEIWICDADGSNLVQLTSWGKLLLNSRMTWSPDGRRLAFGANVEGHSEVFVLSISGGSPQRRTFTTNAANLGWSKDGRWILFDSTDLGIYKVPAEGGPAVLVRHNGDFREPRESPDGRFIYGIVSPDRLARVPTGGGDEQLVLSLDNAWGFALVEGGIYFIPKREPKSGYSLQFLNTVTEKIQRIASVENEPLYPTVSPDRRWILYTQQTAGPTNLMLVENFR